MSKTKQNVNYVGPFITMVVLMALVGFITVMNQQFQAPMKAAYLSQAGDMVNTLTTFITFSFFLAYLLMGGLSAKSLAAYGYRGTLLRGLIILVAAFGIFELSAFQYTSSGSTLTFLGATVPHAYFIFLLGSFVAGTALTFLQSAINPYVVACEVKGTSGVQRQTIAGAGNSTLCTIAPIFVAAVIFQGKTASEIKIDSLFVPFAILMAVVALLAFILTKLDLPNVTVEADKGEVLPKSVWSFSHLTLGVLAIFFYVGVEVAVGANVSMYAESLGGSFAKNASTMAALYFGGMLIGRLGGSFVSKISAQAQLLWTSIGAGVLVVLSMISGNPWLLVGVGLFHSIMWPAIFSLAIAGLGKYTSKGSGALMMGVVGGAVLPLTQGIMADALGNWSVTWVIVAVSEAYLLYYAVSGYKIKQSAE
jgi:FHS family L-fucose permease-like MFS transporter